MTARAAFELDTLTIRIPMRLQRRGGRKLIVMPEGAAMPTPKPSRDETLVKGLVRSHRWRRKIESGQAKSITDIAEQENVTVAYVCRLLPLTCLAPDIVEAILDGRQPKELRLAELLGNGSMTWEEQRSTWKRMPRRDEGPILSQLDAKCRSVTDTKPLKQFSHLLAREHGSERLAFAEPPVL